MARSHPPRLALATALLLLLACSTRAQDVTATSGATAAASPLRAAAAKAATGGAEALRAKLDARLEGVHERMGALLKKAGVTPEAYESLASPLHASASASNLLAGIDAVRGASEKTLTAFYGLLLDNTKELRKALEDGNGAIAALRALRGAECEPASFKPPTAKPASIAGAGGSISYTAGGCTLIRAASPLTLAYNLTCTRPALTVATTAPRYRSRFECRVTRRYGVESKTTITLLDPAAFFAATADAAGAAPANASDGGDNGAAGPGRGAAWYKALFPLAHGKAARLSFVPPGVAEVVANAMKQVTVESSLTYQPFSISERLQAASDAITCGLEASLAVKREALRQALAAGVNMTTLFDGIFAKTAAKLMSAGAGADVGQGKAAAAAAAAAEELSAERPLRTLLARARQGAGQPVAVKLDGSLDQLSGAAGGLRDSLAGLLAGGGKPGSVLELLGKDPRLAQRLQGLAAALGGGASAGQGGAQASSA
ncbi:hypothetical protein HT031_001572 [Scenedesmus sp. PABB004]|nr:hypothetical protein HT031_001572 [Scenedesmus sp. PABB004]